MYCREEPSPWRGEEAFPFLTALLLVRRECVHPSHCWVDTQPGAERRCQFNCGTWKTVSLPSGGFHLLCLTASWSLGIVFAHQNLQRVRELRMNRLVWGSFKELQPTRNGDLLGCPWGSAWNINRNTWMSPWVCQNQSASECPYCPQFCSAISNLAERQATFFLHFSFFHQRKDMFIFWRVTRSFQSSMAWSFPPVPAKQRTAHVPWQ